MTLEDIGEWIGIEEVDLVKYLESLEREGHVGLYRTRKGIALARITLAGLQKTHPPSITATFLNGWIRKTCFRLFETEIYERER